MSGAPALVVLAGGASERLGTCKALVDLAGRTPLARLVDAGRCFDGAPALVVAGAHFDAIARARPRGVEIARNERWREGRTTSVAIAARARAGLDLCLAPVDVPLVGRDVFDALLEAWRRDGTARAWLAPSCEIDPRGDVAPHDVEHAGDARTPDRRGERRDGMHREVARDVAARATEGAQPLAERARVVRFGHPIVIGSALAAEFARALDQPGFDWNGFPLSALRERAEPLLSVRVAHRAILDDLDTQDDLARLAAEARSRSSTS